MYGSAVHKSAIPQESKIDFEFIKAGTFEIEQNGIMLIAENKNVDGYEFIDSCWAKLAKSENLQTPYVFLIVLKKINE